MNLLGTFRPTHFKFAMLLILAVFSMSQVNAATIVIDQDTTINAANSYPEPPIGQDQLFVEIQNGPTAPTVALTTGGVIGGFVDVRGSSNFTMSGGQIQGQTIIHDQATLTVNGGSILPLIRIYQASDVTGILELRDSSTLNVFGGDIFGKLYQQGSSTINVFGYGLNVQGMLPTSPDGVSSVKITGFYPDGQPLALDIARFSRNAVVTINTIPEPSVWILVFCVLISLPRLMTGR